MPAPPEATGLLAPSIEAARGFGTNAGRAAGFGASTEEKLLRPDTGTVTAAVAAVTDGTSADSIGAAAFATVSTVEG